MSTVLQWNPLIVVAALLIIAAAILVPLTRWSTRKGSIDANVDRVVTIVGGGFIFISAFMANTLWQNEGYHHQLISREFAAASDLAEDVIWYSNLGEMDPALANRLLDNLQEYGRAVGQDELTQLTGLPRLPPGQGSARADAALYEVGKALDQHALSNPDMDRTNLWEFWRNLTNNRTERISLAEPLATAMFGIMAVTGLATLVLLGIYPAVGNPTKRWIATAVSGIVVVSMFAAILMLVHPAAKQAERQGPIKALHAMIATRN
jgi:hypothetical protein